MEWGPICLLIFLILLYVGVTATIIVALVQSSLALSPGIIIFIVCMVVLVSFIVSCIVYHITRACNAAMMSVHPDPPPNQTNSYLSPIPPPLPHIPLQTKSGTLIQQPDGHLQIAIYEYPATTKQCAPTSSVPTTKQADLETCTTSVTTSTN